MKIKGWNVVWTVYEGRMNNELEEYEERIATYEDAKKAAKRALESPEWISRTVKMELYADEWMARVIK